MDGSPGPRSQMVIDARALLSRTVETIAASRTHNRRSRELVQQALEHTVWSDYLVGESRLIADQLHGAIVSLATAERHSGEPPEKVVMLLKGMVIDAKVDTLGLDAKSLIDDVVRWGIESYYAA